MCRRVSFHGFDFLPSSGRTQSNSLLTSLLHSSSTRHGPPLWNLSPLAPTPTPFKPCGDYYFSHLHERCRPHTSFLWLLFPTLLLFLLPPSLPPLPLLLPPSWIFFWTWPPKLRPVFIPCLRIVACRPPDPICVVCSQTGAARAKCQAPSCCLHLPQWPAQCPFPCPTLNPTARPLTADSPRPHLRVSDPAETVLKTKPTPKKRNIKKQIRKSQPSPGKGPLSVFFLQLRPIIVYPASHLPSPVEGNNSKHRIYCGAQ